MRPEEQEAIKQARAANGGSKNGKNAARNPEDSAQPVDSERTVNTKTGAQKLHEKLAPAIAAVADFTEDALLGGIGIGLNRFATGNFSEKGEKTLGMVTDFQASLGILSDRISFQLMAAEDGDESDESKKMLPAGTVTADAVTVS